MLDGGTLTCLFSRESDPPSTESAVLIRSHLSPETRRTGYVVDISGIQLGGWVVYPRVTQSGNDAFAADGL